jgi:hypothetical protein
MMARGFESKSAQSAAEDAESQRNAQRQKVRSVEEIELERQRESLELSRRRIVHELEAAQSDLRKRSLEAALAHLDTEIAKLG